MEPKVTVIVPVYNAEEYLNRCVDSILNQEYEDLELILVNDGSTDRSGEICQAYEAKDPRVILLTKENSGVSDSRNLAVAVNTSDFPGSEVSMWYNPDQMENRQRATFMAGCDYLLPELIVASYSAVPGV